MASKSIKNGSTMLGVSLIIFIQLTSLNGVIGRGITLDEMEEASKHERETSPPGAQIPFAPPPPSSKKQRAFLADGYNAKWPNSEVIYDISDDIPDEKRFIIAQAFAEIQDVSCVTFKEKPENMTHGYLVITSATPGCYASLGYQPTLPQMVLNLEQKSNISNASCFYTDIIVHELYHVLGAFHEQSRWDRDEHVKVLWENIIPPEESEGINLYAQFMKVGHLYGDPEDDLPFCDYENPEPYTDCHERVWTESYGSCYDFQSIMHYPANAFSRDYTTLPTLVPVNKAVPIEVLGSTVQSPIDIFELNAAYQCPDAPPHPASCPFQDSLPLFDILPPKVVLTKQKPCMTIQSGGYPSEKYTVGVTTWEFETANKKKCPTMEVKFWDSVDIFQSKKCRDDNLLLRDGTKTVFKNYCGQMGKKNIQKRDSSYILTKGKGSIQLRAVNGKGKGFRANVCAVCEK